LKYEQRKLFALPYLQSLFTIFTLFFLLFLILPEFLFIPLFGNMTWSGIVESNKIFPHMVQELQIGHYKISRMNLLMVWKNNNFFAKSFEKKEDVKLHLQYSPVKSFIMLSTVVWQNLQQWSHHSITAFATNSKGLHITPLSWESSIQLWPGIKALLYTHKSLCE